MQETVLGVDLVGLLVGGVGHLYGFEVRVHRHARQAGSEDVVLDKNAELAVVAVGVAVEDGGGDQTAVPSPHTDSD